MSKKKKLECPKCKSGVDELVVIGVASVNWTIQDVDDNGEIHPDEGVDWNLVEFDKDEYKLGCRECFETFKFPKGFKLQPGW